MYIFFFDVCLIVKGNIPDRRKVRENNKILNNRNGMECGLWCDSGGGTDKNIISALSLCVVMSVFGSRCMR